MDDTPSHTPPRLEPWLEALQRRHLADLRVAEVTRALRALSSAYVERRHKVRGGATLDSAGKRAAFALYYGPLHFLAAQHALQAVRAATPTRVIDLGAGTGVVGAAWALHGNHTPPVVAIDRHPWAVEEARRTLRDLRLHGDARRGDLGRLPPLRAQDGVVAAYVLNELPEHVRQPVEDYLIEGVAKGASVFIVEPLARGVAPWWDRTAERFAGVGGRADEWRVAPDVPDIVATLGKAAGLSYRELRFRTIYARASP